MAIVGISDLHYEFNERYGVDESLAWEWLLSIVDRFKPSWLLCAGDWGSAVTLVDFKTLLNRVNVLSIFGNHENMPVLRKSGVLLSEGKVYNVEGFRVAGIHGIVHMKRRSKAGVPRRKPVDFTRVAEVLANKVDILLLHEVPYLPEVYPDMRLSPGSEAALEAIKIIKPRLVLGGHMHKGCYSYHVFPWGTTYLRVDSSQSSKCCLLYTSPSPQDRG